jgi:pyruvate dehydrogenase E2 component (dihydrolipoamide acetyltransferase)
MADNIVLTMDGTLLNWLKNVGDSVNQGEVIAEVEADKATVEVEAPANGTLVELRANVGEELKEGSVIGVIGAAGEAAAPAATPAASGGTTSNQAEAAAQPAQTTTQPESQAAGQDRRQQAQVETKTNGQAPAGQGQAPAAQNGDGNGRVKASPVARNVAAERGIDLAVVQGTGPGGRIVKSDVENYEAPAAAPSQPAAAPTAQAPAPAQTTSRRLPEGPDVEILDVSKMRARIASSTAESKGTVPHFYVTVGMNVEPLLALRKQINDSLGEGGTKVSINDMFVKATALTLLKFPNLNTHFYGDKLVRHKRINIGISVALPNNGLMNVVSKDADKLALTTLARTNREIIDRALDNKIKPDDIQGATFTISNIGPKAPDVEQFSAIISPPEAGIIAIGSARKIPVVTADGQIVAQTQIKVTISVDHRVSDGSEGALFLEELKAIIENPMRLL